MLTFSFIVVIFICCFQINATFVYIDIESY